MKSKTLMEVVTGREIVTPEDKILFINHLEDQVALECLHGVCLHSPDSRVCLRDRGVKNEDTAMQFGFTVLAEDYVYCGDCGALMMYWSPDDGEPTALEPHTMSCFYDRHGVQRGMKSYSLINKNELI